jgi:hypothetical protein
MADFAAARFNRVILVECLVDLLNDGEFTQLLRSALFPLPSLATLMSGKIDHKLQLAKVSSNKSERAFVLTNLVATERRAASHRRVS